MSILVVLLSLAAGAYALAVIERWAVHGHLSLTGPAWAALALMGQESLLARKSDWLFFELGPVLLLVAGLMAVAVIPLAPELIITDLATGALFLNAALAYVLVALIMAGWGPNGAYAMIAGWRFLGQFIAYAMLIVMPITAVAMRAESLSTVEIVASQAQLWNVLYQPMGFVLFVVAAMGLAWLPPLDWRRWGWPGCRRWTCPMLPANWPAGSRQNIPACGWRCCGWRGWSLSWRWRGRR